MKKITISALSIVLISTLYFGCTSNVKVEEPSKISEAALETIIKSQVDSLYANYEKFGYDWIEFYADEFTAIYPDTPIKKITKDSLISQWDKIYDIYDVQLLDRGKPSVIVSEGMAISYNSFNEIFINKVTSDTIKNVGTYIINWKRQPDDSWKIVFETLHNN
tara:strand:- start:379 stop:867 length:489 start_codon:yes stop_codon:yes gene_type:complete